MKVARFGDIFPTGFVYCGEGRLGQVAEEERNVCRVTVTKFWSKVCKSCEGEIFGWNLDIRNKYYIDDI